MKIILDNCTIEMTVEEMIQLADSGASLPMMPQPKVDTAVVPAPKPKAPGKQPGKPSKAVQVKFGDEWKTFATITEAAKQLGGSTNGLCTALKNGSTFHGHEVRRANPDLDACLKEIEESNRRPYEPTKK